MERKWGFEWRKSASRLLRKFVVLCLMHFEWHFPIKRLLFSHCLICIGVIFQLFSPCLFIECVHCRGAIGPPLWNYNPPQPLLIQTENSVVDGFTMDDNHMRTPGLSTYEKSLWRKSSGFIMQMQSRAVAFSADVLQCHLWIPSLGNGWHLFSFLSVWGLGVFGAYLFRTLAVSLVI